MHLILHVGQLTDKGMHMDRRNGRNSEASRGRGPGSSGTRVSASKAAAKKKKKVYSFWGAAKYTFVLSLLLWWLPIFGQIIAGYVGGRKAGSPNKGMLAALLPVGMILLVIQMGRQGIMPEFSFLEIETSALIVAFGNDIPQLTVYMEAVVSYMASFLAAIESTTSLSLNSYIITVAFAYVGGILADQTRREMEYMVGRNKSAEASGEDLPRSWLALKEQESLCFECFDDCMAVRARGISSEDGRNSIRSEPARDSGGDFFLGRNQDAQQNDQVFAALMQRAEANDPEKERIRHRRLSEEADYI